MPAHHILARSIERAFFCPIAVPGTAYIYIQASGLDGSIVTYADDTKGKATGISEVNRHAGNYGRQKITRTAQQSSRHANRDGTHCAIHSDRARLQGTA